MAQRRMFSLTIVNTDNFLDMPQSTQNLYFHLGMRADDDGFIDSPKRIIKMVGSSDDDLKLLIMKQYVIPFDGGICVIRDWGQNNYIQKDRYKETVYKNEKSLLLKDDNGSYTLCEKNGYMMDTQVRLGKESIDKDIFVDVGHCPGHIPPELELASGKVQKTKKFIPPVIEDVSKYCKERKNGIDAEKFIDYYQAKGWMIGKNKMKDWKAAIRTWEKNNESNNKKEPERRIL